VKIITIMIDITANRATMDLSSLERIYLAIPNPFLFLANHLFPCRNLSPETGTIKENALSNYIIGLSHCHEPNGIVSDDAQMILKIRSVLSENEIVCCT